MFSNKNIPIQIKFVCAVVIIFTFGCQSKVDEKLWHIKATYYESCSCNAPCPCPFGLPMTNSFCKLNALLDIQEGVFNDINLKGVKVLISGSSGQWGEYYFPETVTDAEIQSVRTILQTVNISGFDSILVCERTKILFDHSKDSVRYSSPNIQVRMRMIKGKDDQPVIVQNLKGKYFENYSPYFSIRNVRSFSDPIHDFSFDHKAGFSAQWNFNNTDF